MSSAFFLQYNNLQIPPALVVIIQSARCQTNTVGRKNSTVVVVCHISPITAVFTLCFELLFLDILLQKLLQFTYAFTFKICTHLPLEKQICFNDLFLPREQNINNLIPHLYYVWRNYYDRSNIDVEF